MKQAEIDLIHSGILNYGLVDSDPHTPPRPEKKYARFAVVLYGRVCMRFFNVHIHPSSKGPGESSYANVAKVHRNLFANIVAPSSVGNNTVGSFVQSQAQSTAVRDHLQQLYKPKARLWED